LFFLVGISFFTVATQQPTIADAMTCALAGLWTVAFCVLPFWVAYGRNVAQVSSENDVTPSRTFFNHVTQSFGRSRSSQRSASAQDLEAGHQLRRVSTELPVRRELSLPRPRSSIDIVNESVSAAIYAPKLAVAKSGGIPFPSG